MISLDLLINVKQRVFSKMADVISSLLFDYINSVRVCIHIYVKACIYHSLYVEVSGQIMETCSLLSRDSRDQPQVIRPGSR